MKKNIIYTIIEYLSLTMVLSYILVHNIYFVFVGIIFSLYMINKKLINSLTRSIGDNFFTNKLYRLVRKNEETKKSSSTNIDSNKESRDLTLVESIEELGYIPCIDKNNDKHVA
tara:strand:+ start:630 stop:971 length:342 start_codon:yes stop_codon:yes gene_type:complete